MNINIKSSTTAPGSSFVCVCAGDEPGRDGGGIRVAAGVIDRGRSCVAVRRRLVPAVVHLFFASRRRWDGMGWDGLGLVWGMGCGRVLLLGRGWWW